MSLLERWLDDLPLALFASQYYLKLPYCRAATATQSCALGRPELLDHVLRQPEADVLVVRSGQLCAGERPGDLAAAERLIATGHTVLVRHAERHHPELREAAESFRQDFAAPVNIHIYMTPGGHFGFGWHYDAEEVFILQVRGAKQYELRKNTVHPWPLVETIPHDMQYERELMPLMRCTVAAGDWLYIPSGYWHKATALEGDTSVTLAIGVLAPAAIAVLDCLRRRLVQSIEWRERLPVSGRAAAEEDPLREQLRSLVQRLLSQLQRELQDERLVEQLVDDLLRR